MNPLFKVGEEVILQAVNLTKYNGDHIIEDLLFEDDVTALDGSSYTGYTYKLEGVDVWFVEPVIKKKYPPSEFTFDQLMNSLNLEMVK